MEKATAGPKISIFFQCSKYSAYPDKDVSQNENKESMSAISKSNTPTFLVIEEDKTVSQSPLNAAAKEDSSLQTVVILLHKKG